MSMTSVSNIKKAMTLAHAVFEDNCTGRNAVREQLPNEMRFSLLVVASRFLEVAELFAHNSCTQWSEVATSTVTQLNGAVMVKYAEAWELWRDEKNKEFHKGDVFPRSRLSDKIGYKAILDEEMQLVRLVKDFTYTPKNSVLRDRGVRMGNLVLQIATLAAGIIGIVDSDLGVSVQKRLTHAVVDYPRETAVYLANAEQKSFVIKRLMERGSFEYDSIMKMSNQHIYVITCGSEMQVCAYVCVNLALHLPPLKNKDATITFIETLPGHRRYSLASKLLDGIKITAKNNGYRSICAESLKPDPLFWAKNGFIPYMDKRIRHATCCLDKMSFMNILNQA